MSVKNNSLSTRDIDIIELVIELIKSIENIDIAHQYCQPYYKTTRNVASAYMKIQIFEILIKVTGRDIYDLQTDFLVWAVPLR